MRLFALASFILCFALFDTQVFAQQDGLYDRPVLRLDVGVHVAQISRASVDDAERYLVTGSHDKTIKVWSVADGSLLKTIPMPIGPGDIGKVFAVAISPDGEVIAAGGWMADEENPEHIYLFDRASGEMIGRIEGLSNVVNHLAFSPDGDRLVAMFGPGAGMRLFDRSTNWREIARDTEYGDTALGASFAPDGRFTAVSLDGWLRVYDPDGKLVIEKDVGLGPLDSVSFHPDGNRIAVSPENGSTLTIFEAESLTALYQTQSTETGLGDVSWSHDGEILYSGGMLKIGSTYPVVAWDDAGRGDPRVLSGGITTLADTLPLKNGDLIYASKEPRVARIGADASEKWFTSLSQINARGQERGLLVSHDGTKVQFGYKSGGEEPAVFDVSKLTLEIGSDATLAAPDQTSLAIDYWDHYIGPELNGVELELSDYETSRGLAIHPDGKRFVLGTEWNLRFFDEIGQPIWTRDPPDVAWAVNITGNGRYIVAAHGDGTIRWYHVDTGDELLALFPFADQRNWVIWEPDGRFASTTGARSALKWQVNQGVNKSPVFLSAGEVPLSYRPEVIKRILADGGTMQAVYAAEETERKKAIKRLTGAKFAPGAQLHVLTIGVGDYGEAAKTLTLNWADNDAHDLYAALTTQTEDLWPYQAGFTMTLRDDEAKGLHILDQLTNIRDRMSKATRKDDLAVIHFSGHGMVIGDGADREFYLLPHDIDMASEARQRRTGISGSELRQAVAAIAEHGRVLLLLDACRSGAIGADGYEVTLDADLIRGNLAMKNVTVLTSSSGTQSSWEDDKLRNGAFTEIVLEALGDPGDANKNGLVSVSEFVGYVTAHVQALTGGNQKPDAEVRFHGELFATGR